MNKLTAPYEHIKSIVKNERYAGKTLDLEFIRTMGFYILKNAVSKEKISNYYSEYKKSENLHVKNGHITNMTFDKVSPLNLIAFEPEILNLAKHFFNGNVGYLYPQIFRKDAENNKSVFLHNDICYMTGWFERYSFFIALTDCHKNNGGIAIYPGTHNFGLLGDAGELNAELVDNYPNVQAAMAPGDILIMHSATWHCSHENIDLTDRVYLEIKIQDANDPTTKHVLCGERTSLWHFDLTNDELFKNSRSQRLKQFYDLKNKIGA
ncbi:MAG: phytanoyl-CoA dioxygenase family protein [Pararheinheimera sp.]|nr:phytanoyl-CoA dioxygenase family protein [Rheinheimera sp.]